MADRYLMCERCPLRYQADFYELSGAEELADRIREAGCSWWWGADRGFVGEKTAAHPNGEPLIGCGKDRLPEMLRANAQADEGRAAAEETHRNAVLRLALARSGAELDAAVQRYLSDEGRRLLGEAAGPKLISPGPADGEGG